MRLSQTSPSLISLVVVALSQATTVGATPFAKEALRHLGFSWLQDRAQCASYCGAQSQYCCVSGEGCFTNAANIAYCSSTAGSGGYALYTTTWTDTVTRTSTISSYYQAASTTAVAAGTVAAQPAICTTSLGESSCGTICCAGNQRCAFANSCTAYTSTYIPTSYSAPVKGTSSGGVLTATAVVSATTTQTFLPAATASGTTFPITSSTSHGLSGGAIAGIVIGVIAGIILLLLICFCCIVKAGFDGLLAIFGLGKRRNRTEERVEVVEHYSRHGSGTGSRREEHSGWFGGSRPTRVTEKRKEKSSGLGGVGMVGAGLLGLAAVLGLKRNADKKKARTERSDNSSYYYTDSYTGTSASKFIHHSPKSGSKWKHLANCYVIGSASSDRRTRTTRDTRPSRR
jgi:hypothetical protein